MNADPANCTCERCEIDRERAPYPESTDGQGWTGRGHWKGERK